MKTVGVIDNYISNFHTNTYHKLFHDLAVEDGREEYVITHIYAKSDVSPSTGETTAQWCEKHHAKACDTIQEVCDAVDVIMVLSPNNPELHEELCALPLQSGKPVYVDKTFAPDFQTACAIKALGDKHNALYWSSSATRFSPQLTRYLAEDAPVVPTVTVQGGNVFEIYSIHLIELMNTIMKNGAVSVVCRNNTANLIFEVEFEDGRRAFLNQFVKSPAAFRLYPEADGACQEIDLGGDFWRGFVAALLDFFDTKKAPIPVENTVECIAVRSAMQKAMQHVGEKIAVER